MRKKYFVKHCKIIISCFSLKYIHFVVLTWHKDLEGSNLGIFLAFLPAGISSSYLHVTSIFIEIVIAKNEEKFPLEVGNCPNLGASQLEKSTVVNI